MSRTNPEPRLCCVWVSISGCLQFSRGKKLVGPRLCSNFWCLQFLDVLNFRMPFAEMLACRTPPHPPHTAPLRRTNTYFFEYSGYMLDVETDYTLLRHSKNVCEFSTGHSTCIYFIFLITGLVRLMLSIYVRRTNTYFFEYSGYMLDVETDYTLLKHSKNVCEFSTGHSTCIYFIFLITGLV